MSNQLAHGQCWTQPEFPKPKKLDSTTMEAFSIWIKTFEHVDNPSDWLDHTYQIDIDNDGDDEIIMEGGSNGGGVLLFAFEKSDKPSLAFSHNPIVEENLRTTGNIYPGKNGLYVKICGELYIDIDYSDQFIKSNNAEPACARKNWRMFQYHLARRAFAAKELNQAKEYLSEYYLGNCKDYLSASEAKDWIQLSQDIDNLPKAVWSITEPLSDLCMKMPLLESESLKATARALFNMDSDRSALSSKECTKLSKTLELSESLTIPNTCWLSLSDLSPLRKIRHLKHLKLKQSAGRCWGMTIETKDWSPLKTLSLISLDLDVIGSKPEEIIASALLHLPKSIRHLSIRTWIINAEIFKILNTLKLDRLRLEIREADIESAKQNIVAPSIKKIEVHSFVNH